MERAQWRFLLFVAFVVVTGATALFRSRGALPLTPETVRDAVHAWGAYAPVVFVGAFALRPFLFFPSTLLFLAGGLAFGVGWGTCYAAVGGTLGAVLGFGIARLVGHDFVRAQLGERIAHIEDFRWGPGLVLLLNLIPLVPMTAINYAAGLSDMELLPFTVAVMAGLTPRALAYSFFGHSLLDWRSKEFVFAIALLALLVVVPLYVRRHFGKRAEPQTAPGTG